MAMPPILEIYVLWHPDDAEGGKVADALLAHFRGTTYSGLIGGAVEVYVRSKHWQRPNGPPRPLPFVEPLPHDLPSATLTAVVPVLGKNLVRAVQEDEDWRDYLTRMVQAATENTTVKIFPLPLRATPPRPSALGELLHPMASLNPRCAIDPAYLCRELAHAIAEAINDPLGHRLQVFISHTKTHAPHEPPDSVDRLLRTVRDVISENTRLIAFFDEKSLRPSEDWFLRLEAEASSSALLVVRTDAYAGREWCQREVLCAKRAGMPVVTLYAVDDRDERGSFLMDHVPSVPLGRGDEGQWSRAIGHALDQLVDEALKRALWDRQRMFLQALGFQWLPPSAPEPVTLAPRLRELRDAGVTGRVFVMHPDPPLGPAEIGVLEELSVLAGLLPGAIDVMTPRTFASRGGRASDE